MYSIRYTFLIAVAVTLIVALFFVAYLLRRGEAGAESDYLRVVFIDVGQGDATYIESPAGTQVLIDGGRDASVLKGLTQVLGYFDRDIDMIVATHPDLDHIAGLVDVLHRYTVRTILMTENESDTPVFQAFMHAARAEGASVIFARRGQVFDLGMGAAGSTTLAVLFPDRDPHGLESNTASIITQLRYGDTGVMLTGDSPQAIEEYVATANEQQLVSDVLKAGHHGSRTSSSQSFVEAVSPRYAIISAGKDNEYGHPHKEVMELFRSRSIETKNTAEVGSIILESDGSELFFR